MLQCYNVTMVQCYNVIMLQCLKFEPERVFMQKLNQKYAKFNFEQKYGR